MIIRYVKLLIKKLVTHFKNRNYTRNNLALYQPNRKATLIIERHREIISDPLNVLIERVPHAGFIDDNRFVTLHNGNKVQIGGKFAYYEDFSDVLVTNRGVHEPLEEYIFQTILEKLKILDQHEYTMLELGAYWGHYSMWFQGSLQKQRTRCTLVEPDSHSMSVGKFNFEINGFEGTFINEKIGNDGFQLENFLRDNPKLDILHSDIQGAELFLIEEYLTEIQRAEVRCLFISTHSNEIHSKLHSMLDQSDYKIVVSSDFEQHSTSYDGFICAINANAPPLLSMLKFDTVLGREEIQDIAGTSVVSYLNKMRSINNAR